MVKQLMAGPFVNSSLTKTNSEAASFPFLTAASSNNKPVRDWREERGGLGAVASRYGVHNSISLGPVIIAVILFV
jgi:hypothetical protein